MANETRHMLQKLCRQRVYPGENMAYGLVKWLNLVANKKAKDRIVSLITTAMAIDKTMQSRNLPSASFDPDKPGLIGDKSQFATLRQLSGLTRRFNRLLARYELHPQYSRYSNGLLKFSWIRATNSGKLNIDVLAGGDFGSFRFGESDAMPSVCRLGENGYLRRVRRCRCGRWFYARFKHKMFCGEPCQQNDFRKTDQFREQRRKYMREYRVTLAKLSGRTIKRRQRRVVTAR